MVGDIWSLKLYCKYGSQVSVNTWHYVISAQSGPPLYGLTLADWFRNNIVNVDLAPVISNDAILQGIVAFQVKPHGTENPALSAWGINGTGGAGVAGSQLAALTRWDTGFSQRKGRGRTYWPFVPPASLTNNSTLTTTARGKYNTLADVLKAPFTVSDGLGNTWDMDRVIFSRVGNFANLVNNRFTPTILVTQRRRSLINRGDLSPFG